MTITNRWILQPKPNPRASLRLFCFPFAGQGALGFRTWPDALPSAVEVCPVQLPGREDRMKEPPFSSVLPLVDSLRTAILPALDKPFAFFGHSMGALIAFELASLLGRDHKLAPECLLVSARVAPSEAIPRARINKLPQAEFLQALGRLNGTPKAVLEDATLMQFITPLLRADLAVHEDYTYTERSPLGCPIVAFGGLQDTEAGRDAINAWQRHTTGEFVLRMVPGDHFFIVTAQSLFLRMLSQELYPLAQKVSVRTAPASVTA
jgi:medium-chain acyl-[acyl-carrier-protein] hydrolase